MVYILAGLILGIVAGLNLNIVYEPEYSVYISLAILAIINTIFDILASNLQNNMKLSKSLLLLISDLFFALSLGYVGEKIGLPIYLAPIFAFGNSIFNNTRLITNNIFEKINKNK
jgi:small basic protein